MIVAEHSPPSPDAYLRGLNLAYGDWGDAEDLRWAFMRDTGAGRPHFLTGWIDGELAAGSAVVWRHLRSGRRVERVGIMSGSWTLPDARGRGFFSSMVDASITQCHEVGAARLLAFVTNDNASRRRLESAGANMIATCYAKHTRGTGRPLPTVTADTAQLMTDFADARRRHAHFEDSSIEAWAEQMRVLRDDVHTVEVGDAHALIADRDDHRMALTITAKEPTKRREILSELTEVGCADKPLLTFATDPAELGDGWEVTPGFVTDLPVNGYPPLSEPLRIENGDRV